MILFVDLLHCPRGILAGMIAASLPYLEQLDLEAAKALLIAQHATYIATLSSHTIQHVQVDCFAREIEHPCAMGNLRYGIWLKSQENCRT